MERCFSARMRAISAQYDAARAEADLCAARERTLADERAKLIGALGFYRRFSIACSAA